MISKQVRILQEISGAIKPEDFEIVEVEIPELQDGQVLVENKLKNQNKYFGRNIYLNSVIFEGEQKYIGKVINVKVTKVNRNTLFGKIDHNKNMRAA